MESIQECKRLLQELEMKKKHIISVKGDFSEEHETLTNLINSIALLNDDYPG